MTALRACLTRLVGRGLLVLLVTCGALAVASPAHAHLELESSSPAAGTTVAGPLRDITLTFTLATSSSAATFTLYDRTGATVPTTSGTADDGVTWLVTPAAPLEAGPFAVTWSVAAADGHPMQGTVGFTVAGTPAESAPATDAVTPAPGAGPAAAGATPPLAADAMSAPADALPADALPADALPADALPPALAAAVAAPDRRPWQALGAGGRWLSYAGALVAVGAILVTLSTLVGSRGDIALAGVVVRVAAGAAVLGGALEAGALMGVFGDGPPVLAAGAAAARVAGGTVLLVGAGLVAQRSGGRRSHDVRPLLAASTSGSGLGQRRGLLRTGDPLMPPPPADMGRMRAVPVRPGLVIAGCALLAIAFLLDGHTVSTNPWPVAAAADLAHVAAAATWAGGVVLLAVLLIGRARIGVPTGAGELAVRFSVPATAAAAAVGVTGALLALLIIDTPAQLVTTPWGRLMLLKLAVVAAVATVGYVNNRYAVPALDAWRPGTARMLRRTVLVEALIMLAIVAVTVFLVAARI